MKIEVPWMRLAVLAALVSRAPGKPGRTALMKFAYLLQTLRNVPLGYNFQLYNYGPYDTEVLNDLSNAEAMQAVSSRVVHYSNCYGYEYSTGEGYGDLYSSREQEMSTLENDINWVIEKFGRETASNLELCSTIVFASREMQQKHQATSAEALAERVQLIKPHFSIETIRNAVRRLSDDGLVVLSGE